MTRPLFVVTMILSALAYELRGTLPCRWGPSRPPVVRVLPATRRKAVAP